MFLERGMTRRNLFKAGLGALGLYAAGKMLSDTPDKSAYPETESDYVISPGWIEKDINVPFIDSKNGHLEWLKAASSNGIIRNLTAQSFQYFFANTESGHRLGLGDIYKNSIDNAIKVFSGLDKPSVDPRSNLYLEAVHAASIAVAIPLMPLLERKDLLKFGLSEIQMASFKRYWQHDGLGALVLPPLFKIEGLDHDLEFIKKGYKPRAEGYDRSIHFANHFLITFEYLYSFFNGLKEHESIPRGLKWGLDLKGLVKYRPSEMARAFSYAVGRVYKIKELENPVNWPLFNEPPGGHFNKTVDATYAANDFGTDAAIKIFRRTYNGRTINDLLQLLNDPKYSAFSTPPVLS